MRIAWFTHRYLPCIGGAETYGRAMVRRFVEAGHQVDVITSDALDLWYFVDPGRRRLDEPAEDRIDGARVLRLPIRHFPFQRYIKKLLSFTPHWPTRCRVASYMPVIPGLGRVRGDYDAVFAVGFPFTVFSYAALQTARAAGAPLILTPFLHLATPGDPVHKTYTMPHQVRLLAEADAVVVVTSLEANAVAGWGIPRERLLTMKMAVEHAEVTGGDGASYRARLGLPAGRPVVGQLSTLDPNKGTNDLIHAIARINASRPTDEPVHLLLAGRSSPDFEGFAAALPVSYRPWLTLLGPIPDEDRPRFYDAIDVFAMPSRTDSFGIVFLEAWANGKPVVAAAAGGVVEVVEHDRTGRLVPFGDVEALANAVGGLVDDPAEALRLGRAGRALVESGYTWDDRFAQLDARTHALIEARRGRTRPLAEAG